MTYRELQRMRMDCYKNFIEQKYGKEQLDKLELAIKSDVTNKILEIRDDQQFIDEITELRESREKCENCKG